MSEAWQTPAVRQTRGRGSKARGRYSEQMYLQLAIIRQLEGNQTKTSSMGQDNLLAPVLGLNFQRRPVEEQVTPAQEWAHDPPPETNFGSRKRSLW